MTKKTYIIIPIAMIIGVALTEFFNPGELLRLAELNYSQFPVIGYVMGALESTFQIRDPFTFQLPLPIPILSDFILILPEVPFIITWIIAGLVIGLVGRRVTFGTPAGGLTPVMLLMVQLGLVFLLQPPFWVALGFVAQVQYGFQLAGPLIWAAIFAAIAGTIGGRITSPAKYPQLMVDMSQIELYKGVCHQCHDSLHSNAQYCLACEANLTAETS
jgi:hypothetical protein